MHVPRTLPFALVPGCPGLMRQLSLLSLRQDKHEAAASRCYSRAAIWHPAQPRR